MPEVRDSRNGGGGAGEPASNGIPGPPMAGEADASDAAIVATFGDAAEVVRLLRRHLPPPFEPVWKACLEIGTGLLPAALGHAAVDVRRPGPVVATRLAGPAMVEWRVHRFAPGKGAEGVVLRPLSPGEPIDAVAFDPATATVRVRPTALPAGDGWRLYALARGDIARATPGLREVFALARAAGAVDPAAGPAELVRRGLIVEGWARAVAAGWDDEALAALALLGFSAMTRHAAEAASAVEVPTDRAFLRDDLAQASGRLLGSLQQSLIERLDA